MKYSYNLDKTGIIFASTSDLNASSKDLSAVCDAVRYMPVPTALKILDGVINDGRPIEYKRHNKYMGSRHELQGKKGRYPIKCAMLVKKVIVNAAANATNKGESPDYMFVVHASANKTQVLPRSPPKGVRAVRSGGYGYTKLRTSNLDLARIEIGIAEKETKGLGSRMKRAIKATGKMEKIAVQPAKKAGKPAPKPLSVPQPAPKAASEKKTEVKEVQKPKTEETAKV